MFTASRHAQRLAGNFLDDVDEFHRASRDADRRAMSHFDAAVDPLVALQTAPLPPAPFILRGRSPSRNIRFGSVPPISPAATVQYYGPGSRLSSRASSVSRIAVPQRVVAHYYSDLTGPSPITTKRVYHSPMATLPPISPHYKPYYRRFMNGMVHPAAHRPEDHEIMLERRRIDRKLDDLLSYKLPDPSIYNDMKTSLRKVRDKMNTHRTLLDRYSAIDMADSGTTTEDRISNKYREIHGRLGI